MKKILPWAFLGLAAWAAEPAAIPKARIAQGGAENLDAVRNVRLEGTLRTSSQVFRYQETWTDREIVCTWKTASEEISRGFDGEKGWLQQGSAVELPKADTDRLKEGLRLRRMMLLRFDPEVKEEEGVVWFGEYRLGFGSDDRLSTARRKYEDKEATWTMDEWVEAGKIRFPSRWRVTLENFPAAATTYQFTKVEVNVELETDTFTRELRKR